MSSKKKSIEAKIVKHAHRRRFQEYVRTKGRDKATIGYVYWLMFHRSGAGNVFELEESLFLGDLGITHPTLLNARKTLINDGWLSKSKQTFDPKTGRWSQVRWVVNTEAVVKSVDNGTVVNSTAVGSTDDGSADSGSTDDGSVDDTVVSHPLYADASTLPVHPSGVTSPVTLKGATHTEAVSQSVSKSSAPAAPSPLTGSVLLKHIYPVKVPSSLQAEELQTLEALASNGTDWDAFFAWHKTHKPAALVYRSVEKFLAGVDYSLNDFAGHDPSACKLCKATRKSNTCYVCGKEGNPAHRGKHMPKIAGEDATFCDECHEELSKPRVPCICGNNCPGFCEVECAMEGGTQQEIDAAWAKANAKAAAAGFEHEDAEDDVQPVGKGFDPEEA